MKCLKCQHENPETSKFCAECGTQLALPARFHPVLTKTIETAQEELISGSTIANRYEIIDELGKGGMGVVYKVTDPLNPGRQIALKSIRRELTQPELVGRFKAEFHVLTSLHHPNVAAVYDFESLPGCEEYFFTMEFVEGRDIFHATGGASWQEIVALLIQVCRALSYVHSRKLIHYDVKPGNILVGDDGRVKVLDFGLAAVKSVGPGEWRGGTPGYMAPELADPDTPVDHRSDLYSLGIMAYQLFCRQLPFRSRSLQDLFRLHRFEPLGFEEPEWQTIPSWLRSVIERLCAKHPADRYPTANTVIEDINRQGGLSYEVETAETRESYIFSSRFVGRRREYDRACDFIARRTRGSPGYPSVLMVSGQSGSGKSRLIQEVRHYAQLSQILFCQGRCFEGSFSEFQPLVPMLELLTRRAEKLCGLELVREHGPELVKISPSLRKSWGIEPSLPLEQIHRERVRLQESITDFLMRVADLVPYVVYVDDLQWALSGLTELLAELVRRVAIGERKGEPVPIALLGTYREEEVAGRPLEMIRDALLAEGRLEEMKLDPLGADAVEEMLGSMLGAGEPPEDLVDRITRETSGNPFYVEELMRALVEQDAVRLAGDSWEIKKRISEIEIPNTVAKVFRRRTAMLDDNQRVLLEVLAVCGRPTAADVLARGTQLESDAFHSALSQLLERRMAQEVPGPGLLIRLSHDRLREIVYGDLESRVRANLHLTMARSMEAVFARELKDHVFDIVDQYNAIPDFLIQPDDRDKVIKYNELAGHQSKKEGAFEAAGKYFRSALALLPSDSWETDYERIAALSKASVEVEYLGADLEEAERHWRAYVERVRTKVEKVEAYIVKIEALIQVGRLHKALASVREALSVLGVRYPARPGKLSVGFAVWKAERSLKGRTADDFQAQGQWQDLEKSAEFALLAIAMPPIFMTYQENLYAFYVAKLVQIETASTGFPMRGDSLALYAFIRQMGLGDIEGGGRLGEIALQVVLRKENSVDVGGISVGAFKGANLFVLGCFVFPWTRRLQSTHQILLDGYRESMREGRLLFACYSLNAAITQQCMYSDSVDATLKLIDKHEDFLLRLNNPHTVAEITALRQMLRQLSGLTKNNSTFDDDGFNENQFLEYLSDIDDPIPIGLCFTLRIKALFIMGLYEKAYELLEEAGRRIVATRGQFVFAEHCFFHFLTSVRRLASAGRGEKRRLRRDLRKRLKLMKKWARCCSENFAHKQILMEAELARIGGEVSEAQRLYKEAVTSARESGFPLNATLGSELAGRFELERGRKSEAATWLRAAREGYMKWGARAKVKAMDDEFTAIFTWG
jgi:predicted ATPase